MIQLVRIYSIFKVRPFRNGGKPGIYRFQI